MAERVPTSFRKLSRLQGLMERAAKVGTMYQEAAYNPSSDSLVIRTAQDVEPILDNNKELQVHGGYGPESKDMQRVASIPMIVVQEWLREGIKVWDPNDWPEVRRRLNDPSNVALRTRAGRL